MQYNDLPVSSATPPPQIGVVESSVLRSAEVSPRRPGPLRLMQIVVAVFAVILPLTIQRHARDAFREPKDIVLAAEAIILVGLSACLWVLGVTRLSARRLSTPFELLAGAGIVWLLVSTTLASNHRLAIEACLRFAALLAVFLATAYAMHGADEKLAWALLVPALINAVVMISQAGKIWSPYPLIGGRIAVIGFLGNPDDAAGYLVAPAILAMALTTAAPRRRWIYVLTTLILAGGVAATQTISAVAALVVALPLVVHLRIAPRRRLLAWAIVAAMSAGMILLPLVHPRLRQSVSDLRHGNFASIGSNRLLPFTTALEMARDHPFIGVGPGCYGYQYFHYQIRAVERYGFLSESLVRGINFAEAHNDHLQVLAETGLVGYALFAAALVLLALRSRGAEAPRGRKEVARVLGLPLAAGVSVLCAAHFALQIAASASVIVQVAAVCFGWRRDDEVA
jgi:O-antigen ligase